MPLFSGNLTIIKLLLSNSLFMQTAKAYDMNIIVLNAMSYSVQYIHKTVKSTCSLVYNVHGCFPGRSNMSTTFQWKWTLLKWSSWKTKWSLPLANTAWSLCRQLEGWAGKIARPRVSAFHTVNITGKHTRMDWGLDEQMRRFNISFAYM